MVKEAGEAGVTLPAVGDTLSHAPPEAVEAAAVKVRDPPPRLFTVNCFVETPAPWKKEKDRFCISRLRAGGAESVTVTLTLTVRTGGLPPGAVIVMVASYVPLRRFAGSTLTRKVA